MQLLNSVIVLGLSYLIGSIPAGLLMVKLFTGKDVRLVQSGRTGGTNVIRAAGLVPGLITIILDLLKGVSGVMVAKAITPGNAWLEVLAPIMIIVGHNYSIYLIERDDSGRIRLRGGAGGTPSLGGAVGLWFPSIFILLPVGAFFLFGVGYASVATMVVPFVAMLIFGYRAWIGASPWQYILYGLIAEFLLVWSLRPNIKRLFNGTERLIGWRAKRKQRETQAKENSQDNISKNRSTKTVKEPGF